MISEMRGMDSNMHTDRKRGLERPNIERKPGLGGFRGVSDKQRCIHSLVSR